MTVVLVVKVQYPPSILAATDASDTIVPQSLTEIMDNLPQELVDLIVDQLYFESANSLYWRQTLTRYSMSSTRFRAACLRWLFRSVSVEDGSQSRNLASYRALITSSPCLVSFIQELQVQLANIQLPLLQQILSDLPRLHSLVLVNVSLFGAPTPVKTPLRSLSLSHVTTNDSIVLNTLLGLFLGIEHFKLHVWNPTLLVDDRIDYLNPPLQLKQLSLSTAVTTAVNAQYLFRAIRNAVASCMTLRACLVPLYLEEWGALISSVARSIVNLEFAHVIRPGGLGRFSAQRNRICPLNNVCRLKLRLAQPQTVLLRALRHVFRLAGLRHSRRDPTEATSIKCHSHRAPTKQDPRVDEGRRASASTDCRSAAG